MTNSPTHVTIRTETITELTPPALQMYLYLLATAESGNFSQRSAARALSRSLDSVQRAVRNLEDRGLITIDRTRHWAPVYRINGAPTQPAEEPTAEEPATSDAPGGVIDLFGREEPAEKPKKYRRPKPGEYTEEFSEFWSLVTRKQSKADAARLFEEAVEEVGAELVIDRARQYYHLKQLEGTETRYIKSGKNWLRDRLYEDDLTEDLQRAVLKHAQSRGSRYAGLVPSEAAVNDRLVEQYVGPVGPSSFREIEEAERGTQFGK